MVAISNGVDLSLCFTSLSDGRSDRPSSCQAFAVVRGNPFEVYSFNIVWLKV